METNNNEIAAQNPATSVRTRVSTFVGKNDKDGLHHVMSELLDNSVDEGINEYGNLVYVVLDKKRDIFTICDNGRGIPFAKAKGMSISQLELACTVLHAGGKFDDGDDLKKKNYAISSGLNGLGLTIAAASAKFFRISSLRGKNAYTLALTVDKVGKNKYNFRKLYETADFKAEKENSKYPIDENYKKGHFSKIKKYRNGTMIEFQHDREFFPHDLDEKIIDDMLYKKNIGSDVRIIFKVIEKDGSFKEKEYDYAKGRKDFPIDCYFNDIKKTIQNDNMVFRNHSFIYDGNFCIDLTGDNVAEGSLSLNIDWCKFEKGKRELDNFFEISKEYGQYSMWANSIYIKTPEHDQILKGLTSGILDVLRDVYPNNKCLKVANREDVVKMMVMTSNYKTSKIALYNQTKDYVVSEYINKFIRKDIQDKFREFIILNKDKATDLISLIEMSVLNKKTSKVRAIKGDSVMPSKLVDIPNKDRGHGELFITEGDSAAGSVKSARNKRVHAIMPIRGKILNVIRINGVVNIQNIIKDLITVIGSPTGDKFNMKMLRYKYFIIFRDADNDGSHIENLLIGFFYKFYPKIIKAGRLLTAISPLYRISHKNKDTYFYDTPSMQEYRDTLVGKFKTTRYKGIGEMNFKDLKLTTMSDDSFFKRPITWADHDELEIIKSINDHLGADTTYRKSRLDILQKSYPVTEEQVRTILDALVTCY